MPPALLADLRRQATRRSIARRQNGPQSQRLQPVGQFEIDQQPFIDYAELPSLKDAIHKLLSPSHSHGNRDAGHLARASRTTLLHPWHRDWRDNVSGLRLAKWNAHMLDDQYFNQVNCPLYADSCVGRARIPPAPRSSARDKAFSGAPLQPLIAG